MIKLMKVIFSIRFLIVFFLLSGFCFSQTSVQGKIDKLLSDKFFESTHAAIDVYDLTNKDTVYQKNVKYLMHPASNMKILTSAAGLVFLGPDYNFETTLYYKGDVKDRVLNGDIYIVGGFDPIFSIIDLDYFVNAIDSLRIKKINGNILADVSNIDTMYWGKGFTIFIIIEY